MFDTITPVATIIARTGVKLTLCGALLVTSACVGPAMGPTFTGETEFGSLEVTTLTTGTNLDPDGYTLMLDEFRTQPIAINDTALLSNLAVGPYSAQLLGVAANCSVANNPLSITVVANTTALAVFTVTCT